MDKGRQDEEWGGVKREKEGKGGRKVKTPYPAILAYAPKYKCESSAHLFILRATN